MSIRYLFSFCKLLYRLVFWGAVAGFGVTTIGIAFLMVKLTYSPLSLNFIKPSVEQGITRAVPNLKVQIGKLQLTRNEKNFRLIIKAQEVKILGTETNQPILSVPRMDLQLSVKSIFTGEFLPRAITLHGSKLNVYQREDGIYAVDFNTSDSETSTAISNWDEAFEIIAKSNSLKRIHILDGTIAVENQANRLNWTLTNVEAHFARIGKHVSLNASAKFEGTRLTCTTTLDRADGVGKTSALQLSVHAALENLPFNQLHILWPEFLAPLPRHWVTTNLSDGLVTYADINTDLQLDLANSQNPVHIQDLGGKIQFSDMTVGYFEGFPKVTHVNGQATYDQKNFYFKTQTGSLLSLEISSRSRKERFQNRQDICL